MAESNCWKRRNFHRAMRMLQKRSNCSNRQINRSKFLPILTHSRTHSRKSRKQMRIDSHQHFWRYSPVEHPWMSDEMAQLKRDFLPEDLQPLLQALGFDGCVAVQASQTLKHRRWLLELAGKYAFIKGVV